MAAALSGRAALNKMGVFSYPGSISVGDPYDKRDKEHSRLKVRRSTHPGKTVQAGGLRGGPSRSPAASCAAAMVKPGARLPVKAASRSAGWLRACWGAAWGCLAEGWRPPRSLLQAVRRTPADPMHLLRWLSLSVSLWHCQYCLQGKQFSTRGAKTGANPDALLDSTYKRLSDGEPFFDPGVAERRAKKKDNPEVTQPFKPPQPSKVGVVGGCIGPIPSHVPVHGDKSSERRARVRKEVVHEGRNFVTSSTKKGTYSSNVSTTIGDAPAFMFGDSPSHGINAERAERRRLRDKITQPFVSGGPPRLLDSKVYVNEPGDMKPRAVKKDPDSAGWRPAGPNRTVKGTISVFPEHVPEPLDDMLKAQREEAKAEREKKCGPAFYPCGGTKTMPIQSINPNNSFKAEQRRAAAGGAPQVSSYGAHPLGKTALPKSSST